MRVQHAVKVYPFGKLVLPVNIQERESAFYPEQRKHRVISQSCGPKTSNGFTGESGLTGWTGESEISRTQMLRNLQGVP